MKDIRHYSVNELSLLVFNDEFLYQWRHTSRLIDIINDIYIYTDEQLEVLNEDLNQDLDEVLACI